MLIKKLKNFLHFFYAFYGAIRFGFPSEKLLVIGITGTSGKTSTIHFLRQVLEQAGFKVGSLSTADFYIDGELKLNDKKMTMVGRYFIQEKLREMVNKKCDIAIVETTSEGYLQHRHKFINYDLMALTNLYPEHIEAHGGFENYKRAKLGIFEYVAKCKRKSCHAEFISASQKILKQVQDDIIPKTAVVNGKSEYADEFLQYDFDRKIVFGQIPPLVGEVPAQAGGGVQVSNTNPLSISPYEGEGLNKVQTSKDGLQFTLNNTQYFAPLYGEHNAENLACVVAITKSLNISEEKIKQAIAQIKSPPGRIEFIKEAEERGFQVIVDYAFEPVALQKLYEVVALLQPKRVIHVCGSTGGGRDKARREPIGKLVGKKADIFIVTDEDPYDEDPLEIIKQVSAGAQAVGKKIGENLFEILDRKEAIEKAILLTQTGDLILITGKGSEQKMCTAGGQMIDWDDREVVRKFL